MFNDCLTSNPHSFNNINFFKYILFCSGLPPGLRVRVEGVHVPQGPDEDHGQQDPPDDVAERRKLRTSHKLSSGEDCVKN